MKSKPVEYRVRVHEDEDGTFWAEVLDLPGCFASGESLDELKEALSEAISLYLSDDDTTTVGRIVEWGEAEPAGDDTHVEDHRILVDA